MLKDYEHNAKYYETDQMGCVHHSNYIRWMEEARVDLMDQMGCGYRAMEEAGVCSPVLEVNCRYKSMVRFGDTVRIHAWIKEYLSLIHIFSPCRFLPISSFPHRQLQLRHILAYVLSEAGVDPGDLHRIARRNQPPLLHGREQPSVIRRGPLVGAGIQDGQVIPLR